MKIPSLALAMWRPAKTGQGKERREEDEQQKRISGRWFFAEHYHHPLTKVDSCGSPTSMLSASFVFFITSAAASSNACCGVFGIVFSRGQPVKRRNYRCCMTAQFAYRMLRNVSNCGNCSDIRGCGSPCRSSAPIERHPGTQFEDLSRCALAGPIQNLINSRAASAFLVP